jgi:hypothetical protein
MPNIEKPCVICGQSCAGKPRIKDNQGRYAHKACAQKKQDKSAQPEIDPLDLSPEEEPEMASFLDDLPTSEETESSAGIRAACPGCGSTITSDAIVCMNCGCNTKTGRGNKTKSLKAKSNTSGAGIAAKAGSFALAPVLPIIGASIGGVIGAAVWAAVAYFLNFELGILAIGVGWICGLGAALFSRGGNAYAGGVAVVIALIAIIMGKLLVYGMYYASLEIYQEELQAQMAEPITPDSITPDQIYQGLIDQIAQERIDHNQSIDWGRGITLDDAVWPEDYPQDLVDETIETWDTMNPEDQHTFKQDRIVEINQNMAEFNELIEDEMDMLDNFDFWGSLSLWDGLWAFLALGAAWGTGNGSEE